MNNKPLNRFLLDTEEISCKQCQAITGHIHSGKYWTCVHCGNQIGVQERPIKKYKPQSTKFKDFWNSIIYKLIIK